MNTSPSDPLSVLFDPLSFSIPTSSPRVPADPTLPTRKLLTPSPTHPDDYILEIDNSSLEVFSTCPRASENKLVLSREAATSVSATSFGQLFHLCEELRLLHGLSPDTVAQQRDLVREHFLRHPTQPNDHRTESRMIQVLDQYNQRYANDQWPEKVLVHTGEKMVEKAFKVELMTLPINGLLKYPYSLVVGGELNEHILASEQKLGWKFFHVNNIHVFWTGRIDVVLQDSGGIFVADHKTSSIGGETYYEDFRLSSQTVGYTWAAQKLLNTPVLGLILNALIIRKPSKTGTPTEFDRRTFFYSQDRLAEWEENVKHLVSDFVSNLVRGYFPQHTKWCMGKYGKCPYHANCCLPREQRAVDLASDFYRNTTWNPVNK